MKNGRFVILLFFMCLTLRLFYVIALPQQSLSPDACGYDKIAVNISGGHGFSVIPDVLTPTRAPGYPIFLSLIYRIGGHSFVLVRIAQAFLNAFICIFIYLIALWIFDAKTAKLSALLYAFYPVMFAYTGMLLSEILFTFFLSLTVLLYIKASIGGKTLLFALAGVSLALATLTRGVTVLFPLFLVVTGYVTGKKFIKKWLAFVLAMALTIAPWTIRNAYEFKKFIPICTTGAGMGLFVAGYEASGQGGYLQALDEGRSREKGYPSDRILCEKMLSETGFRWIKQNPVNYFFMVLKRFPRFWWTSHSSVFGVDRSISEYLKNKNYFYLSVRLGLLGLQGIILILAATGIFLSLKTWRKWLIAAAVILYFSGHAALDPCPRYHIPALPYVFIFAAAGLSKLKNLYKSLCSS